MSLLHDSAWWEAARSGQAWMEILSLYNFDKDEKPRPILSTIRSASVPDRLKLLRGTARVFLNYINIERAAQEECNILCEEYERALAFYNGRLEYLDQLLANSADMLSQASNSKLMELSWNWTRKKEELVAHEVT